MSYQWIGPSHSIDSPLSRFDIVISTDTTRGSAKLHGDLDLTTAPRLEQILDQLRRDGYRHITLDLSGLEFLGACALSVFIRVDQALRAADGQLILTSPPPIVARVLSITGLDTALTIH
ncbi:MAG: STAS domain-containing protein [Pseudonocardiaceae bacterium]